MFIPLSTTMWHQNNDFLGQRRDAYEPKSCVRGGVNRFASGAG